MGIPLEGPAVRFKHHRDLKALPREEIERLCFLNMIANPAERFFFKDRDSAFLLVSTGWLSDVTGGRAVDEVIGLTDAAIHTEGQARVSNAQEQQVMDTGEPFFCEALPGWIPEHPDTWVSTVKMPLRDEDGDIIGTWGITRDVTAQMEAEQTLHARERQYRSLFERNPQPILAYARDTLQIVLASNAAVAAYGYSIEEFLSMTINDLAPAEDGVVGEDQPTSGFAGTRERRHQYKDGTIIDVEITSDDVTLDDHDCRIVICLNVTERKRAAAELAAAHDAAVQASNMKSAWLANISHEIRTPMNGVLGVAELLLDTDLDPEQRALAEQVTRSGELMLELINDILDISKIEAGQLDIELTDFALRETIEQACALAVPRANANPFEFVVQIDDGVPQHALGDGHRLRQVILNLVSNAVKFTSSGAVTVHASTPSRQGEAIVRIEVSDTGIGIEASRLTQMFEPFTQADVSTTREYGGTGLGLAIAGELVELMGGTIGADSTPGVGSTFWIELSLPASATSNGRAAHPADASSAAASPWSSAPRVLVAEDSPVNQMVAVRTLERCGCRADVANNGRQALEMLSACHYDAVLMDCQMPDMDGYAATAELRRRENGERHTPVIAMTALAMTGAVENCLAAGMDDYLGKPIRRAQLIQALQRWIPPEREIDLGEEPS